MSRPDPAREFDHVVVNLYPNPRLCGDVDLRQARGDYAGGRHIFASAASGACLEPAADGCVLRLAGRGSSNDVFVCPGGPGGRMRLSMLPGRTYTFAATLQLDAPLTGLLHRDARRIVVDRAVDGSVQPAFARSAAADNIAGRTRLAVTFTVPPDTTEASIRLVGGAGQGHGDTWWSQFTLTETPFPVAFFDGDGASDDRHDTTWTGARGDSTSRRALRAAPDAATAARWLQDAIAARDAFDVQGLLTAQANLPEVLVASARALLAELRGEDDAARRLLANVVASDGDHADARIRLGDLWARKSDWPRVVEVLAPIAETAEDARVWYGLSRAHSRMREFDAAATTGLRGLAHDATVPLPAADAIRRSADGRRAAARASIWRLTAARLDEIRARAATSLAATTENQRPRLFTYWAQGAASAPPLVRVCLDRMRALHGDDLVVLGQDDLRYWVDLPAHVRRRVGGNYTHLSDLVRIELLKTYGGTWLDATCWLAAPVPDGLASEAEFFAFSNGPTRIASWLLAARSSSYVVHLLSAALDVYWESHDELVDYFLLHHTFEALVDLDDEFARQWHSCPTLDAAPAHAIQAIMNEAVDEAQFARLRTGCFVHKLTTKPMYGITVRAGSLIAALVRGDLGG